MSRLGIQISSMRTAKGMTRKQLGKAVGVTEKFIEELETGKKAINDDLVKRISKVLQQEISGLMTYDETQPQKDSVGARTPEKPARHEKQESKEVNAVWNDALESVLKAVPVYGYDLAAVIETRQLPVMSNKIEGYQKDKVFYLKIQDDDMAGFRIAKGDTAFGYLNHEVENGAFCLVEYKGRRAVRQVKKLDSEKVILVSNGRNVITEACSVKDIKVLARLIKIEFTL